VATTTSAQVPNTVSSMGVDVFVATSYPSSAGSRGSNNRISIVASMDTSALVGRVWEINIPRDITN
jgi:hypothetical protein